MPADAPDLAPLIALLSGRRVAILTGAGISTESGIPDYRGPETRRRARSPVQFATFTASPEARARYWARSVAGWARMIQARPNPAHHAVAALELAGVASGAITQNVDRLHHAAGSRDVIELHGALAEVRCLDCGARELRDALQRRMRDANPHFDPTVLDLAPDGDAEIDAVAGFVAPVCLACAGRLKPDVVFFGESVPKATVERAYARVEAADALLVVGSSLAVFSGYRFVRRAAERGLPVAIVNLGETRGDPYAAVKVDGRAGDVLPALAAALTGAPV